MELHHINFLYPATEVSPMSYFGGSTLYPVVMATFDVLLLLATIMQ